MSENEIKTYRVKGTLTKHHHRTPFTIDVRATKMDTAIFKVQENLGSRHKVKRNMIKIKEVNQIKPDQTEDVLIRQLEEM